MSHSRVFSQLFFQRNRDGHSRIYTVIAKTIGHDAVQLIFLIVKLVIRQLIIHPKQNEKAAGKPNGKTGDVDECINVDLQKTPKWYNEEVIYHVVTDLIR